MVYTVANGDCTESVASEVWGLSDKLKGVISFPIDIMLSNIRNDNVILKSFRNVVSVDKITKLTSDAVSSFVFCEGGARTFFIRASAT